MTINQIRSHALNKLAADGLNISSIMNILAEEGITSDEAVKSIMESINDIAKKEGRPASLSDLAGVLSNRAQNAMSETAHTVGSTVGKAPVSFGRNVLKTIRKYKAPVAVGLAGAAAGGKLYSIIKSRKKRTIFDRIKGVFA